MLAIASVLLALIAQSMGAPCPESVAATTTPIIYIAGDSTMAKGGGGAGTDGWGQYLGYSMNIPVVNKAIAGRSARSYAREGRFTDIANTVKQGDFVVIELGHNDGGSLTPTDNGRSDCPGSGTETCQTTYNGVKETVLTFPANLENAAKLIASKGATVIISSQTPSNPDESGKYVYTPSRFVAYAQLAANTTNSEYIDHGNYCAHAYESLASVTKVDALFPIDHTHTAPAGADLVAKAFVKALSCSSSSALKVHIKNVTIAGSCL
ncbi:carbohydrate esterase family 12 protein [Myriangium duriaei CBS 260.36]|uniref:Carbohydrate esterase family 12 protein n=1 Tax=Myriangium duriaei CBS 260.36 TaxID=1168546 RepID=A0A9P4J303_9PEZI|nr:carbohydrate esterase family 12 protein [Myriangium duriaei CBS 260.36]